jgi:germination protein M
VIFVFTACSNGNRTTDSDYTLYYVDPSKRELMGWGKDIEATKAEDIIKDFYEELKTSPDENMIAIVPANVILNTIAIDNNVLYMDFSDNYHDMKKIDEALFKAAVVKTMVQVEGIDYVSFYINGHPLTNANGTDVGLMSNQTFIDGNNTYDESITWVETVLYFSDSAGDKLVGEKTNIAYNKNTSIEKVVIEYLLNGPSESENRKTLPSNLNVISASTKDGTCYVNFNSAFLSSLADVSAKITLYSLVNTLCELPSVKNVQFLVNGSSDYSLRETYSLAELYERNLDLIKQKE